MQGPDVHDRFARESDEPPEPSDPRSRRLGDAQRRIEALARRVPDDMAPRGEAESAVTGELASLAEELSVAHAQLRRQTEELEHARQLLESERDRFRELFEIAPEGHVLTDPSGNIREMNRGAAALLNLPPEYAIGKPLSVFVAPDDRRAFRVRSYPLKRKAPSRVGRSSCIRATPTRSARSSP